MLSVPLLGPKSWHCLPSLGYTDTAAFYPLGLGHGFDLALLRLSGCSYPVPWSQRQDWDHHPQECAIAATHSLCHYCISPSWGHRIAVVSPQGLWAWLRKMCTCLPSGTGTSITAQRHWGTRTGNCPVCLMPKPRSTAH